MFYFDLLSHGGIRWMKIAKLQKPRHWYFFNIMRRFNKCVGLPQLDSTVISGASEENWPEPQKSFTPKPTKLNLLS